MEPGYMLNEDEQEMDIRDMFSWMIMRWKLILCFALAGCILLGLFGVIKSRRRMEQEAASSTIELDSYKKSLSEAEAMEVENTYSQYQIYQNYIKDLGRFSAIFSNSEKNGKKILMLKYYLASKLKYGSTFYTEMAISSEDYKKIYQIAYPDDKGGEDETVQRSSPLQVFNDRDVNTDVVLSDIPKESLSIDAILITAFITADTEEQCEEIRQVVDSAFEKETQLLKETDKDIVCRCVDAAYASDQNNYYDNVERQVVERLNIVNNALSTLKNNYIDKFSGDQKSYFDALKASYGSSENEKREANKNLAEGDAEAAKKAGYSFSRKTVLKYGVLGAFAGCFLACCLLLFIYVTNDRIQTNDELYYYGIQNVNTLYYIKNKGIFGQIARKIRTVSTSSIEVQEQMLAEDISIMMKGLDEGKKLYILLTSSDKMDIDFAEKIKNMMSDHKIDTIIGDPLRSPEELKQLSEADRVIILAHAKVSKRDTIKRVKELCRRYDKELSGAIVIEVC